MPVTGENLIETIWRRNVFDINHISFGINRFSSVLHLYEQTECRWTEKFIGPISIQAKTVSQKPFVRKFRWQIEFAVTFFFLSFILVS